MLNAFAQNAFSFHFLDPSTLAIDHRGDDAGLALGRLRSGRCAAVVHATPRLAFQYPSPTVNTFDAFKRMTSAQAAEAVAAAKAV